MSSSPGDPSGGTRTRRAAVPLALAAIVATAIALRLVGLGYLLPYRTSGDSQVLPQEVELLRSGEAGFQRGHELGLYPNLLPRMALLVPAPVLGAGRAKERPIPLAELLERAARPRLELRTVIALASVLLVPATFLLARRFLDQAWALAAAFFPATSLLDLWFAQQERPHAAAAAFYTLAVVAALALRRDPGWRNLALACLGVGASLGTLQSGIFVVPAVAAALWLPDPGGAPRSRRFQVLGTLALLLTVAISIRFFYPFVFDDSGTSQVGSPTVTGSTLDLSGHSIRLERFNGRGAAKVLAALWSYEPLLLVLASGGALLGLARLVLAPPDAGRRRDLLVAAAHALPYLAATLLYEPTRQRFCIPLLPYAAVLAAAFLRDLHGLVRKRLPAASLRTGAAVLIFALPAGAQALCGFRLACVRASPDTLALAAAWIRDNVRPSDGAVAINPETDLPILRTGESRRETPWLHRPQYPWFCYQCCRDTPALDESEFEVRAIPLRDAAWIADAERSPGDAWAELGCRYAVIEVYKGWGWKQHTVVRDSLACAAECVARFEPDPPGSPYGLPIEFEDDGYRQRFSWFLRILRARRTGPLVEIYRIGG